MAANTSPIYSRAPDVQWGGPLITANTTTDLTSGTIYLLFTADATEGGRVDRIKFVTIGSNTQTVVRIWINNGGSTGTATNNTKIKEITLASTSLSQNTAQYEFEWTPNLALPAGYSIYATIGTTVATGWLATVIGGKY